MWNILKNLKFFFKNIKHKIPIYVIGRNIPLVLKLKPIANDNPKIIDKNIVDLIDLRSWSLNKIKIDNVEKNKNGISDKILSPNFKRNGLNANKDTKINLSNKLNFFSNKNQSRMRNEKKKIKIADLKITISKPKKV